MTQNDIIINKTLLLGEQATEIFNLRNGMAQLQAENQALRVELDDLRAASLAPVDQPEPENSETTKAKRSVTRA